MLINGFQKNSSSLTYWCSTTKNTNTTTDTKNKKNTTTTTASSTTNTSLSPKSILQLLHTSLGSNLYKSYTKQLSLYLKSKLSLTEFERFTNQHFLSHQVQLHNKLIFATVRSATQYESLTSSPSLDPSNSLPPYTRKRKNLEPHEIRRARLRKEAFALPKQDRDRIRLDIKKFYLAIDYGCKKKLFYLFLSIRPIKNICILVELQQEYERVLDVPTCQQEQELPHRQTMRDRMTCIAYENHLKSVSEDAVDLMILGLHSYLKNLLSTILYLKRDRPLCHSSTSSLTPFPLKPQTSVPLKSNPVHTSPSSRRSTSPLVTATTTTASVPSSAVSLDPTPSSSSSSFQKNISKQRATSPHSITPSTSSSPNFTTFVTSSNASVENPTFSNSMTTTPAPMDSTSSNPLFPPPLSASFSSSFSSSTPSSPSSTAPSQPAPSASTSTTTTTTSLSDVSVILWIQPNLTFNGFPHIQEKLITKLWHPPATLPTTPMFSTLPTITSPPMATTTTTSTTSNNNNNSSSISTPPLPTYRFNLNDTGSPLRSNFNLLN